MKKLLILAVSVSCLALAGCSMSRQSKAVSAEQVAASHETSVRRAHDGETLPNVTVSGSSNVVTVSGSRAVSEFEVNDAANTKGAASGESRSTFRGSLSTWLAVAFAALALTALLVGFVVWRNGSAAGRAADAGLAEMIRAVRSKMATATSTTEIAAYAAQVADLESTRGRMKQ